MNYPSKLIEEAVKELSKLPGIGKKTALRLSLHLLKQDQNFTASLAHALQQMRVSTQYCKDCHAISDQILCKICSNHSRESTLVCVVAEIGDLLAIENTAQYRGVYHVLNGLVSPIDGIGPAELNIESLLNRAKERDVQEVILALPSTMEGDTTAYYLTRKLQEQLPSLRISTIARGIAVGSELEYTDEVTLGRSIIGRISLS
ncbi:MAG: recombination protein RecR [Cytophagales bacterium]|nr:MAG: recombination protein RecR [Cytophagales bacterium]TAF60243.1 MAG: recombination protein RecR [Cytophagales bacterium]